MVFKNGPTDRVRNMVQKRWTIPFDSFKNCVESECNRWNGFFVANRNQQRSGNEANWISNEFAEAHFGVRIFGAYWRQLDPSKRMKERTKKMGKEWNQTQQLVVQNQIGNCGFCVETNQKTIQCLNGNRNERRIGLNRKESLFFFFGKLLYYSSYWLASSICCCPSIFKFLTSFY